MTKLDSLSESQQFIEEFQKKIQEQEDEQVQTETVYNKFYVATPEWEKLTSLETVKILSENIYTLTGSSTGRQLQIEHKKPGFTANSLAG